MADRWMPMPPAEAPLQFGLRFPRSAGRVLDALYDRAVRMEFGEGQNDPGLFEKAATATREGEPLIVFCTDRSEVEMMAALFAQLGAGQPAIEDLNGG